MQRRRRRQEEDIGKKELRKVAAGEEAGAGGAEGGALHTELVWVDMTELHSPPNKLHFLERNKTGDSDDIIMVEREVARHGRVYKKSNWTLTELQVLQTAKREDQDKQLKAETKEKHKSAAERWQWIEDYCWEHGVERSAQQCRDRWERMSADFKKLGDFEKHVPRGGTSYWQMSIEDRKNKKLPSNFQQEVYQALGEWVARSRAVDTIDNVIDVCVPSPLQVNNACANFISNGEHSSAGEGDSPPQDPTRKKRKITDPGNNSESIAVAIEKAIVATQRTMLECEDRKDRRHKETMEANERIANGFMSAVLSVADALRQSGGIREARD